MFSTSNANNVHYDYPGGSGKATSAPYDMVGRTGSTPRPYQVPTTPRRYAVTVKATGGARPATVTASFVVSGS